MKYSMSSSGFETMRKRSYVIDEKLSIVAVVYGASESEAAEAAGKIAKALNEANEYGKESQP